MPEGVDLLVCGPHPDDLEIGLGGAIAKHVALGHRVGLCDLTRGELGTNGTPEQRLEESEAARAVLGASWRENLQLPDGDIGGDPSHTRAIVELIRRARPKTIAVCHSRDRHPDHVAASRLLTRAAFLSGLTRYAAAGEKWRADWLLYYFINDSTRPSFVVDVSALEAMACGVPVVASNVGGLPEVVIDGVTGFLHPPRDLERMAESAIGVLSDPALHARMAAEGVRLAMERFSADRIVPQYAALYERTLGQR